MSTDVVVSRMRYTQLVLPSWAPPASLFGPVWFVLYALLAVTIIALVYIWYRDAYVDARIFTPLLLNVISNATFSAQRDLHAALANILIVVATLVWLLAALWLYLPEHRWLFWINIPYLLWVLYATALQIWITANN